MRLLRLLTLVGSLLVLCACEARPPHVMLKISDPLALADGATHVRLRSGADSTKRMALGGKPFPVTATLYAERAGGSYVVWVDAEDGAGAALARGRVEVSPPKRGTGAAEVALFWACERADAEGHNCNLTDSAEIGICVASSCAVSRCGDGFVDGLRSEQCDDGAANSDLLADACRTDCRAARCGDQVTDTGEQCDDGNQVNEDGCLISCASNVCGDGYRNAATEACDDGNTVNEDACLNTCVANTCGDGYRNAATEACDDGNTSDTDACLTGCVSAGCGDGHLWATVEVCDDGNTASGDGCRGDCLWLESCDNGTIDPGEDCDDQNANPNDGCNACVATTWQPSVLMGQITSVPGALEVGLNYPAGLVLDGTTLYVADTGNHRVLRVNLTNNQVFVHAGRGTAGFAGDGALATKALLSGPRALAVDSFHNLYIGDSNNRRIRRVSSTTGVIETVAGSSGGFADGPALTAKFGSLQSFVIDAGLIYVADGDNHRVRLVDMRGEPTNPLVWTVSTIAGTGATCNAAPPGCGDGGPALSAPLYYPWNLALYRNGPTLALYVSTYYAHRVRRIDLTVAQRTIATVAGTGATCTAPPPSCGDGGLATAAQVSYPRGLTVNAGGDLFIAEDRYRIRRVAAADQTISTVVGTGVSGFLDGPAGAAQLTSSFALLVDEANGRLFFADYYNNRVRSLAAGEVRTDVGSGERSGAGVPTDGRLATTVGSGSIYGLAVDSAGHVYLGDYYSVVWRVTMTDPDDHATWRVDRVAGDGTFGFVDGEQPARLTPLGWVVDLAVTPNDELLIAEMSPGRVRKVVFTDLDDPESGVLTTIAGDGSWPAAPSFADADARSIGIEPIALEVDEDGVVYIADGAVATIWRLSGSVIRAIAGNGTPCPYDSMTGVYLCPDEAPGDSVAFFWLMDLSIASDAQVLYAGDAGAGRVREVELGSGSYYTRTVAGNGLWCDPWSTGTCVTDGDPLNTSVWPNGIAAHADGRFLVADGSNCNVYWVENGLITEAVSSYDYCNALGDGGTFGSAKIDWGAYRLELTAAEDRVYLTSYSGARAVSGGGPWVDGQIVTLFGTVDPSTDGALPGAYVAAGAALAPVTHAGRPVWLVADTANGRLREYDPARAQLVTRVGYPDCWGFIATDLDVWHPARFVCVLGEPTGLAFDPTTSMLYVSERGRHDLVRVNLGASPWQVSLYAGGFGLSGATNGPRASARFNRPAGLALGPNPAAPTTLLVADSNSHQVRSVTLATGAVTTLVGTSFGNTPLGPDETAAANAAALYAPEAVAYAPTGELFIADTGNHRVRKVDNGLVVHNLAGTGVSGYPLAWASAPAKSLQLDSPRALHLDRFGNLFVMGAMQVYLLVANLTGVVSGESRLLLLYGAEPRAEFPASVTSCLSGMAPVDDDAVYVLDSCVGMWIRLDRDP